MLQAMKAYKEAGYSGPFVSDHTPLVEGDTSWGHIGRTFSRAYIRARRCGRCDPSSYRLRPTAYGRRRTARSSRPPCRPSWLATCRCRLIDKDFSVFRNPATDSAEMHQVDPAELAEIA